MLMQVVDTSFLVIPVTCIPSKERSSPFNFKAESDNLFASLVM